MPEKKYDISVENTTHPTSAGSTNLAEMLSRLTSTHELPESMFTKEGGLTDEKAILLIMRHLEDSPSLTPLKATAFNGVSDNK